MLAMEQGKKGGIMIKWKSGYLCQGRRRQIIQKRGGGFIKRFRIGRHESKRREKEGKYEGERNPLFWISRQRKG